MIKRFNQGDLDGLCGLYAIVNAITHRVMQRRDFAQDEADAIFEYALRAIPRRLLPDAIIDGLDHSELLKISEKVSKYIEKNHGRVLEVTAPFKNKNFTSLTTFLNEVSWLHSNRPTAFIFGITDYDGRGKQIGGHWVAFKEFQQQGIEVLNNGKENFIRSVKLRVTGNGKKQIDCKETIMFETVTVDGEPPSFEIGR